MTKVRTQIYLSEEQHRLLGSYSQRLGISKSHIIRTAIHEYLSKQHLDERDPLMGIVALGESDDSLGSINHDAVIYDD